MNYFSGQFHVSIFAEKILRFFAISVRRSYQIEIDQGDFIESFLFTVYNFIIFYEFRYFYMFLMFFQDVRYFRENKDKLSGMVRILFFFPKSKFFSVPVRKSGKIQPCHSEIGSNTGRVQLLRSVPSIDYTYR